MKIKDFLSSEKGITLVELVVAIGIASIIVVVLTQMFISSNKLFYKGEEKSFNQMHMRNAMNEITKDVRYAKNLTMLKDNEIPSGPNDSNLTDKEKVMKYIYFKESDSSIVLLEYINDSGVEKWIEKKYLENRIDIDKTNGNEKSYFTLIIDGDNKSVKYDITDKSAKHGEELKYTLTTTINLLNAENYPPSEPNPPLSSGKYRGIKYKK